MWINLSNLWRQQKRILRNVAIVFGWILLLSFISVIVYFVTKPETPDFTIQPPKIKNYSWNYDFMNLENIWVSFDIKSWGQILRDPRGLMIEYSDWDYITFFSQKIKDIVFSYEESLIDYQKENVIQFERIENVNIKWKYPELLNKKRNETYFDWENLIRVLSETKFDLERNPITSIEVLSWDVDELHKIFLDLYNKDLSKTSFYAQTEELTEKWLKVRNGTNIITWTWSEHSLVMYNMVYNDQLTRNLNNSHLDYLREAYKNEYNYKLNKKDIELQKDIILDYNNFEYDKLRIIYLYLYKWHVYRFAFVSWKKQIELKSILDWDFNSLFIKNIQIKDPSSSNIFWEQRIYQNLYLNIPDVFSLEGNATSQDLVIKPYLFKYRYGYIKIFQNNISNRSRQEILDDNTKFYLSDEYKLRNNNIDTVSIVRNDALELGWFLANRIVYSVKQTHWVDITLIQYLIYDLDNNKYYAIEFPYTQDEIYMVPFFNYFISSIKKVK